MMGSLLQALFGFLGGLISDITGYGNVNATNQTNQEIASATNEANLEIAEKVNATNKEIAESTNAANLQIARETNLAQKVESEKAYQRSTAANQIAEYVRAGFTPQQAKLIVAGSGSPASYPPASLVAPTMQPWQAQGATMQPWQAQAYQPGDFGFSALGSIGDDLFRDDGGSLGSLIAQPALNSLSEHMDDIDKDFWSSPETAQKTYRDPVWKEKHPWFNDKMQKQLDRVFKNVLGTSAFMKHGSRIFNSYSIKNMVDAQSIELDRERIKLRIDEATENTQIMMQKNAQDLQSMEMELKRYNVKLAPSEFASRQKQLDVIFKDANMHLDLLNNKTYRDAWVQRNLTDEQTLIALNDAKKVHAEYDKLVGDEKKRYAELFGPWIGAWEVFDSLGLTKTDAGVIAGSVMGAAKFGIDALKGENAVVDLIKEIFNPTPGKSENNGAGRKF